MTSSVEKELFEILEKVHLEAEKENISLQESHELYFVAKDKYFSAKKEERTEEAGRLMLAIFFQVGKISEKFVAEWQGGKFRPTEKELKLLKEGCKEVLTAFDNHFKPNLLAFQGKPYKIHQTEVKEKINKIRKLIQQEEFGRKQFTS